MGAVLAPTAGPDLLFISDVHLHEESSAPTVRALAALFDDYADRTIVRKGSGRHFFRAVLNGDFFDFPRVTSMPGLGQAEFDVTRQERKYGLDATGEKTAWKIGCLFRRHRGLFDAMAGFIAAGNEIVFVPGNHDEELLLPEVQIRLRELLGDGLPDSGGGPVRFTPWFYYEPGLVYAEHGHFHDGDGVPLNPLRPSPMPRGSQIEPSLGRLVTRHLLTLLRGYDFRGDSDMTPWPLLVKTVRAYGLRAPQTIFRYFAMAARVLRIIGENRMKDRRPSDARIEEHAASLGIEKSRLKGLLALLPEPTIASARRTAGRLYLDRSAAFAAFIGAAAMTWPKLVNGWSWALGAPLVPLGILLFTVRNGNVFGDHVGNACREAAVRIQALMRTPNVIMGHTHNPDRLDPLAPEGQAGAYFNAGAFEGLGPDGRGHPYLLARRDVSGGLSFETRAQRKPVNPGR